MNLTIEEIRSAVKNGQITLYEDELIENLRDIIYDGLPLSVVVLSFSVCQDNWDSISIYLTLAMDSFRFVRGNINIYPKNANDPNYSWVEKDGYVYNPKDGYKWEKSLYYRVFDAEVIQVYDEKTIQSYDFYQQVIKKSNQKQLNKNTLTLVLQYLELLEIENPTANQDLLFQEIELYRNKCNITEAYSPQVMKKYRQFIKKNI